MGFLNKIKKSIGLRADEDINQATDNINTNISLEDSEIIKNLDKTDIIPPTIENQDMITDIIPTDSNQDMITDIVSTDSINDNSIMTQNSIEPDLEDTFTTPEQNNEDITLTPPTDKNNEDITSTTPETNTSFDNPIEKLKSIKEEKERISDQLEKLTAEIDNIIKNLEKEFTENEITDNKDNNKDTENKEELPIEKVVETTKIIITEPTKKDTKSKETEKDTNFTEKDLKELEEFLSKENIKEMPKK